MSITSLFFGERKKVQTWGDSKDGAPTGMRMGQKMNEAEGKRWNESMVVEEEDYPSTEFG